MMSSETRSLLLVCCSLAGLGLSWGGKTVFTPSGDQWLLNGKPVSDGSWARGLLLSAYTIQGVFDDENPATSSKWAYPDTNKWDPDRNTAELAAALPSYAASGVSAITVGLQGGCPVPNQCPSKQPWEVSAFTASGEMKAPWAKRLGELVQAADSSSMAVAVSLFYPPQLGVFGGNDSAVLRAAESFGEWLGGSGFGNVMVDVVDTSATGLPDPLTFDGLNATFAAIRKGCGSCDVPMTATVRAGTVPHRSFVSSSSFILLKAVQKDGDADVQAARQNVRDLRSALESEGIAPIPIAYCVGGTSVAGMQSAVSVGASWGFVEQGSGDYKTGFGCPPVSYNFSASSDPSRSSYYAMSKRMVKVIPHVPSPWPTAKPEDVGLDSGKLGEMGKFVQGHGGLSRDGKLVFEWGSGGASQRNDVASACKPWYTHFLHRAALTGMIPSVEEKVDLFVPGLDQLNPKLGHKDRNITFHHMANQISCYGVSESPGTAFDYNDFQMALFFDTLFLHIYNSTYDNVDKQVLHPLLTDHLGCQDDPTFMAFGTGDRPGRVGVSPRDFMRFGWLYYRRCDWEGTQYLPQDLCRELVTSTLPNSIPRTKAVQAEMLPKQRSIGSLVIPDDQTDHMVPFSHLACSLDPSQGSYTWLWWVNGVERNGEWHWPSAPPDLFSALGHGCNLCPSRPLSFSLDSGPEEMYVFPSQGISVSWEQANLHSQQDEDKALKMILDAITQL